MPHIDCIYRHNENNLADDTYGIYEGVGITLPFNLLLIYRRDI